MTPSLWLALAGLVMSTVSFDTAGRQSPRRAQQVPGSVVRSELAAAIAAGMPEYVFPAEVVFATGEGGLEAAGATNMRLMGATGTGTTLWFAPGGGLRLLNCANVTVQAITIDYNPLRMWSCPHPHQHQPARASP